MKDNKDFTHFNNEGRAYMVNVGEKQSTFRTAQGFARVIVNRNTFELIRSGGIKKGDVLTVAQIAGIMGSKKTSELIPMCHGICADGVNINITMNDELTSIDIVSEINCAGKTGVEMEALTAASIAALTVYDMCKAVQRDIEITDIRLLKKTGGIHGDYVWEEKK